MELAERGQPTPVAPKGLSYLQHHLFSGRLPQHPPDSPEKGGSRALPTLSARFPQRVPAKARSSRESAPCRSPRARVGRAARGVSVVPLTAAPPQPLRPPSRRPSPAARGSAPARRHGCLPVATRSDVRRGRAPYASAIGRCPLAAYPPSARDWRVGSGTGRGGRGGRPGPAALGGGRDAGAGRGQRTYCLRAGSRR